jgi:hypothetical protein
MKRTSVLALLVAVCLPLALLVPASAAPRTRCFPETGYCIASPILDYWERNGGLQSFGYPLSVVRTESAEGWTGPVQWFERTRLEDHGVAGVMAGRVGVLFLLSQGRLWQSLPRAEQTTAGCRFFPETGHSLCGTFLTYWARNGALARFGFPITEPAVDPTFGYDGVAQLFERARMEWHPELAGTRYDVLLGLLGRNLAADGCAVIETPLRATAAAFPDVLSCPAPYPLVNVPIATEPFERGSMLWVYSPVSGHGWIRVFVSDQTHNALTWELYEDTWREGEPVSGGMTAPAGLYEPIRGFGKLWRTNAHVRDTLGWATATEQGDQGTEQYFRGGAWAIFRAGSNRAFVLFPDYRVFDVPGGP